ncbi:hypothetical protein [Chestnut teal chaphamaparvovirus 3]|uniref:Uncharacterized protein n=1 Tax=Chestnut teal chaphamaparvovirus 3 TaxID=2759405 RepID=A0A7D7B870_9VIRU|nr:hypothetical protein QKU45_gp1 [Chestnut teal chaphamaparvovirus 3]QMI57836.1 hypothetical protein [Chestnut teal chaphamaparvovirus 3]
MVYLYIFRFSSTMSGTFGQNGCTILLWADDASWRLEGMEGTARDDKKKEFVDDAVLLLSIRWNLEPHIVESKGVLYGFLVCPRFNIGSQTIKRALGALHDSIEFHRGSGTDTATNLIRYIECKKKYQVPDIVSEGSSGDQEMGQTSGGFWQQTKRQKK